MRFEKPEKPLAQTHKKFQSLFLGLKQNLIYPDGQVSGDADRRVPVDALVGVCKKMEEEKTPPPASVLLGLTETGGKLGGVLGGIDPEKPSFTLEEKLINDESQRLRDDCQAFPKEWQGEIRKVTYTPPTLPLNQSQDGDLGIDATLKISDVKEAGDISETIYLYTGYDFTEIVKDGDLDFENRPPFLNSVQEVEAWLQNNYKGRTSILAGLYFHNDPALDNEDIKNNQPVIPAPASPTSNDKLASQIIFDIAKDKKYNVNPAFLLLTLQKERQLISTPKFNFKWPTLPTPPAKEAPAEEQAKYQKALKKYHDQIQEGRQKLQLDNAESQLLSNATGIKVTDIIAKEHPDLKIGDQWLTNFTHQVEVAAQTLRNRLDEADDKAKVGVYCLPKFDANNFPCIWIRAKNANNSVQFRPQWNTGEYVVGILNQNKDTYVLYRYTPWVTKNANGGGNKSFRELWTQYKFNWR